MLVYRRVTGLAGHTSRVAELLEQVQRLSGGNPEQTTRTLYNRNVSSSSLLAEPEVLPEPRRHEGDIIKFHRSTPLPAEAGNECRKGRSHNITLLPASGRSCKAHREHS